MGEADKQPLISVIVPVYKVEPYLRDCVDSILAQTYRNLEIILVDDGSPDNCPAICDEYAEKDSRVRVIHRENGGVASARNAGLEQCRGEFITFIDSDDSIKQEWIESLYCSIGEYDFVIAGLTYVYDCSESTSIPNSRLPDLIKSSLFGYICNKLYRRQSLEHMVFHPGLREDLIFNLSLVNQNKHYTITDTTGYLYYQRSDSLIHKVIVSPESEIYNFEKMLVDNIEKTDDELQIYNIVMFSYVTDYIYKLLLSENAHMADTREILSNISHWDSLRRKLKYKYADNTLYRILYLGEKTRSRIILEYGFRLCQKIKKKSP